MLKVGKTGVAIVMGLLLSLILLASGALAEDTTTAQNTTGAGNRAATLTSNVQQGTQQLLPVSSVQQIKAGQANTSLRWRPRHARNVGHFRHNGHVKNIRHFRHRGVHCFWVRRGWGKWRRLVKICHR